MFRRLARKSAKNRTLHFLQMVYLGLVILDRLLEPGDPALLLDDEKLALLGFVLSLLELRRPHRTETGCSIFKISK